jgi:hypothetical protein
MEIDMVKVEHVFLSNVDLHLLVVTFFLIVTNTTGNA